MKRIFSNVMLLAAAATAFFSCQKPEVIVPETSQEVTLTFASEKPTFDDETKTEWNGETIQWSAGDKIRVAYTCDDVWQNAEGNATADKPAKLYVSNEVVAAGETALFNVPASFTGRPTGMYKFYGIYPSTLTNSADINYAPSVTIAIPAEQTPSSTSFDASADVMAATSATYSGMPTDPISLRWSRLVAHGQFTIKGLKVVGEEDIKFITLTANEEADMVGSHYLYLDDTNEHGKYEVYKPNSNVNNKLVINAEKLSIDGEGNVTFWACFLPCTWTSVEVVVETDKATYTRNITEISKTFAQNARNILGIGMASAERVEKTVSELPFVKDFSDKTGTGALSELEGFAVTGSVYNADGAIRLAKGDADGTVTTQALDLSDKFHVIITACGWDSDELAMTVAAGEQVYPVTLTTWGEGNSVPGVFVDYIVNFEAVSSFATVSFKANKGKRCYISKIQILEGAELSPVINANDPAEVAADATSAVIEYTISNPTEATISATESVDWITAVDCTDEGKVTCTLTPNTEATSRKATVTLSYEGAASKNVTISQAAASQQGGGDDPDAGGGDVVQSITVTKTIESIATTNSWSNSIQYKSFKLDGVITVTATGGGNTGKYYTSGNNWRFYQSENPTLTISAAEAYTITSVKITYTVDKTGVLTKDGVNILSGTTCDVNAASVTFGVGNTGSVTNGQVRVTEIEVVYQNN